MYWTKTHKSDSSSNLYKYFHALSLKFLIPLTWINATTRFFQHEIIIRAMKFAPLTLELYGAFTQGINHTVPLVTTVLSNLKGHLMSQQRTSCPMTVIVNSISVYFLSPIKTFSSILKYRTECPLKW